MAKGRFDRYVIHAQQFGARTVLFQHAAASRLGLTPTELETFRLVQHEGFVTASELTKQTGLTAASMSVIVDKLTSRKFLSRKQDRSDRRRWLLQVSPAAVKKVDALYAAHASRVDRMLAGYSDEAFEVLLDFMSSLADELKDSAIELGHGRQNIGVGSPAKGTPDPFEEKALIEVNRS